MTIGPPPVRRKSQFTLRMEEARAAAPMTSRCAVKGCRWRRTGPAGQVIEAAREHRRTKHPELPIVAKRPKKTKPPPRRIEQTAEDKAILRALASRQTPTGQPKGVRSKLDRAELEDMYVTRQMSIRGIAREKGVWHSTVKHALQRYEIPLRVYVPALTSGVTPQREATAWTLYQQGHTVHEIAEVAAPLWGYSTVRQCQRSIYEQFAAHGRPTRPAQRRTVVPELDRARALELLEAAG